MKIEVVNYFKNNEWILYTSNFKSEIKIGSKLTQDKNIWIIVSIADANLSNIKALHVRNFNHEKRPDISKEITICTE